MPTRRSGVLRALLSPPMLLLHAAGILAILATAWLGHWQLDAWQAHRQDRVAELADAAPQPLRDLIGADDAFPSEGAGRPVEAAGRWRPQQTVFVSGRLSHGRDGYWMVTSLSTCGGAAPAADAAGCAAPAAIPVVLGWTRRTSDAPPPPRGAAEVSGWLQPGDSADGSPDADPADDVLPALRIGELAQRTDQDLYSGYLILDTPADARGPLAAVTPQSLPKPSSFTALRNLLYGVQWWIFGLFAVFLWWRWVHDELARRSAMPDEPDDEDASGTPGGTGATGEPVADGLREDPRIPSEP